MLTEKHINRALGRSYWEMRIGLHMGQLVAGIIGETKKSFDVWGDTVNIASRAEHSAEPGQITITEPLSSQISPYADISPRGHIKIHKRGGSMEMYYLNRLKTQYCMHGEGRIASVELRKLCGLRTIDFEHMRKDIINNLKALLPENMVYHDINHTMNVEKAAVRYAKLEGLDDESILLLQTAALYHDAGFILQPKDNEHFALKMVNDNLPRFGYSETQIETIKDLIRSTASDKKPKNLLEKIICDADHDYLGGSDYYPIAQKLRSELENFGCIMSEKVWIEFQLNYLVGTHRFYTETAKNIRLQSKKERIKELKEQLNTTHLHV